MKKINLNIGKVNNALTVKVSLIINTESDIQSTSQQNRFPKIINSFDTDGNNYTTITPRAFVTLDISRKGNDPNVKQEWDPNSSVTLNNRNLFLAIAILKRMIYEVTKNPEIYKYASNGMLVINREAAASASRVLQCGLGKTIKLQPVLVPDITNSSSYLKGVVLFINNVSHYAYLTLEDMHYLVSILSKIDLPAYALHLLNLYEQINPSKPRKYEK